MEESEVDDILSSLLENAEAMEEAGTMDLAGLLDLSRTMGVAGNKGAVQADTEMNTKGRSKKKCLRKATESGHQDVDANLQPKNTNEIIKALKQNLKYQQILTDFQMYINKLWNEKNGHTPSPNDPTHQEKNTLMANRMLWKFRKPYFKDDKFHSCPANEDTLLRLSKTGIDIVDIPPARKWPAFEMKLLEHSVHKVGVEQLQAPLLTRKRYLMHQLKREEAVKIPTKKTRHLLNKVIEDIDNQSGDPLLELMSNTESNIDWTRISAVEFDGHRTAAECKAMWYTNLAPGVNRSSTWSEQEVDKLMAISERHDFQDWDAIAEEHGHGHTGYQCFIQVQQQLNIGRNIWTVTEDQQLQKAVMQFSDGVHVPFKQVATMLPGRTAQQCYYRWNKDLNPNINTGHFKEHEDILLLGCREKNMSFEHISFLLPGRPSEQLRRRFARLEQLNLATAWTKEEDARLLRLVQEQQRKGKILFSKIVAKFNQRSRMQLRNRYRTLKKNMSRDKESSARPTRAKQPAPRSSINPPSPARVSVPKNVQTLVSMAKRNAACGRKIKRHHPIDFEIAEMFRSHYSQRKGRKRKHYTRENLEMITRIGSDLMKLLSVNLDWTREAEVLKCNERTHSLIMMYQQWRQANRNAGSVQQDQLLHNLLPPSLPILTGLHTTLMEMRILLETKECEVQNSILKQENEASTSDSLAIKSMASSSDESCTGSLDNTEETNSSVSDRADGGQSREAERTTGADSGASTSGVTESFTSSLDNTEQTNSSFSDRADGGQSREAGRSIGADSGDDKQSISPEAAALLFQQRIFTLWHWSNMLCKRRPPTNNLDDIRVSEVHDEEQEARKRTRTHNESSGVAAETRRRTGAQPIKWTKTHRSRVMKARWAHFREKKLMQEEVIPKEEPQSEDEQQPCNKDVGHSNQ